MKKKQKPVDPIFLGLLLILVVFGLLMVFSASMYSSAVETGTSGFGQFLRQAAYVVIGLVGMVVLSRWPYNLFNRRSIAIGMFVVAAGLLGLVLGVGTTVNGAKRWLMIGPFSVQPSEFAKWAGIVLVAFFITNYKKARTNFFWCLLCCVLPMIGLCALAVLEPSLSAAIAIAMAMLFAMYFGKVPLGYFFIIAGFAAAGALVFMRGSSWRMDRINVFFGQGGQNYQISQSLLAIGSGGLFGRGLGGGTQKLLYLPEMQNDFIFANVAEETGMLGCLALLALYGAFIVRGFRIARTSRDEFGYIYTSATIALIGFQVIINIFVATGMLPVTGIALPFVSAGGTSVIILLWMMGPILNLSRHNETLRKPRKKTKRRAGKQARKASGSKNKRRKA